MTKPNGIHCPDCLRPARDPVGRYRPLPGVRVRYFHCPRGCRFKSTERLQVPLAPAGVGK